MAQEIKYSSLQLAFLGDAVYELAVRERALSEVSGHVDKLNRYSKNLSNAVTQAQIADILTGDGLLTEEELAVYKRGRNARSPSVPKSCTPAQYRKATGLEALMAYLFLEGRHERVRQLLAEGAERIGQRAHPPEEEPEEESAHAGSGN